MQTGTGQLTIGSNDADSPRIIDLLTRYVWWGYALAYELSGSEAIDATGTWSGASLSYGDPSETETIDASAGGWAGATGSDY